MQDALNGIGMNKFVLNAVKITLVLMEFVRLFHHFAKLTVQILLVVHLASKVMD